MVQKTTQNNVTKTISVMMVLVLLAKASGLLRNMMFMYLLGTESTEAAAFTFASLLPRTFMDAAFAAAISAGFIPIFSKFLQKRSREEAFDLARSFITFVGLVTLTISIVGFFAVSIISGIYFGQDADYQLLSTSAELLRIMIFTMFFTSLAFALTGLSQSLGGFYIPSIMSLVSNGLILGYMWLFFESGGVLGLSIAFVLGNILQVLIFWLPLRKRGFRFRPNFNFKSEGLRQILHLIPMVMISSWLLPIAAMINGAIAANRNSAYFVEFEFANVIFIVLTGVFILSVTNVMLPKLSTEAVQDDGGKNFKNTLQAGISGSVFILLPMAVGIFILRTPIVRLLYERGEFTPEATEQVAYALGILTLGIVGYGLVSILTRAFFAVENGKTPMIVTLFALIINFVVALIFIEFLAIGAVALALMAALNFAGITLYIIAARKFNIFNKKTALNFGKMIVVAAIMFGVLWLVQPMISTLIDILEIGIITILGALLYFALAWLLGIEEIKAARSLISRRKG